MAGYRKVKVAPRSAPLNMESAVIGMLYIVNVRFLDAKTKETSKQRLLLVGGEEKDIERKLRWIYDADKYAEFSVTGIEKVREKIHLLSTVVTQPQEKSKNTILRDEGRQQEVSEPAPDLPEMTHFAFGLTTRVYARDHFHAVRKVAAALNEHGTEGPTSTTARLSADSLLQIEAIPKVSNYVRARDVSHVKATAHFVRG
jgi:hypothetical protein